MAAVAIGPLAALGFTAVAQAKAPTGDYAVFSQCPRFTKGVGLCIYTQTLSGEVAIGSTTVPITKTITLQGGVEKVENAEEEVVAENFVGAINGETLSKTPLKVPGGLSDLVKCNEISNFIERAACELVFENGVTGVNATTELAKPASDITISTNNLVNREGIALSLPVKVKLENSLLGSECYIGSSTSPVVLALTTGATSPPAPNKPIKGKVGTTTTKDEGEFIEIANNTLVNNSFSAPEASGCGGIFSFLIDPIIDSKLSLPSTAGHNTAIENNTIKEASAPAVIASEK